MIDLQKLQQLTYLIKNGIDDETIYKSAFEIISSAIEFDSGTLFLKKQHTEELVNVFTQGEEIADLASEFDFGSGKGLAGWVAEHNDPLIFPSFMNENPNRQFRSFVSIPLVIENNHIGVLNLGHKNAGFYTDKDLDGFTFLGSQLAIIVDKINLICELRDKNSSLEFAINEIKSLKDKLKANEDLSNMAENLIDLNLKINSPLSVITGFTELLLKKCQNGQVESEELLGKLEMILESARNINIVTQQFEDSNSTSLRQTVKS